MDFGLIISSVIVFVIGYCLRWVGGKFPPFGPPPIKLAGWAFSIGGMIMELVGIVMFIVALKKMVSGFENTESDDNDDNDE